MNTGGNNGGLENEEQTADGRTEYWDKGVMNYAQILHNRLILPNINNYQTNG